MELWDVYDNDRIRTGKTMVRGDIPEGAFHLVIHVCIINSEGKMLIQQRQPFKDGWPGMWDLTAGGSAIAGESSRQAIERELFEEIGYSLDMSNRRPCLTVNFDKGFDDIYIVESDVDIDKLRLGYEEVKQVKWAAKEEVLSLLDEGQFVPFYKNLINLIFDMKGKLGALTL